MYFNVDSRIYDNTYQKEIECINLEDYSQIFNTEKASGFKEHSLFSDIIEVDGSANVKFCFCDR